MSATIARSRRLDDSASSRWTVSQRGTRGRRAFRRGRVRRSSGFLSSFSRRTAHLPKLPRVASRTRTDGFESLQELLLHEPDQTWVSCFANRPSQLFDGAQKRLTILVARRSSGGETTVYTTQY